jgi:hypothetical protein
MQQDCAEHSRVVDSQHTNITSARLVTLSKHDNASNHKTQRPIVTYHGQVRSIAPSHHGAINASCGGN